MGFAEAMKGMASFVSGGGWGMWRGKNGRKPALFHTVVGTTSSTVLLSLGSMTSLLSSPGVTTTGVLTAWLVLFTLSGFFSSTFTLTFAYVSDVTNNSKDRLAGYGLALATFGLSFCIGPMAGGAIADWEAFKMRYIRDRGGSNTEELEEEIEGEIQGENEAIGTSGGMEFTSLHQVGVRRVLIVSLLLVLLDLIYIKTKLPESLPNSAHTYSAPSTPPSPKKASVREQIRNLSISNLWASSRTLTLPDPFIALRTFTTDPYLRAVGEITFLYYTSVWAVISSLAFYCNKTLGFGPGKLGELMSLFGVCTVFAEGVLVRIVVPAFGPVRVMKAGLLAFAVQCAGFAFAKEPGHVFGLVLISTVTNLVYPSVTGLVSEVVGKERIGETLGAVNSIKAVTEGFGPLLFGLLMSGMEGTEYPGLPYLAAGGLSVAAWWRTGRLLELEREGYLSEKYDTGGVEIGKVGFAGTTGSPGIMGGKVKGKTGWFGFNSGIKSVRSPRDIMRGEEEEGRGERDGLLSEIEDDEDEEDEKEGGDEEGEDEEKWAYWGKGVESPMRGEG